MAAGAAVARPRDPAHFVNGAQSKRCDHGDDFIFCNLQTTAHDSSWACLAKIERAGGFHDSIRKRTFPRRVMHEIEIASHLNFNRREARVKGELCIFSWA